MVANPSGDDEEQTVVLYSVCVRLWLALPRVSIQPGVAYGGLHFPGCPFSPGLLIVGVTTGDFTAVAVAEHAYGALALAVVG